MKTIALGTRSATGVPASTAFVAPFEFGARDLIGVFQVDFAGTATAAIEGRLTDAASWTNIATILSTDASKAKVVALMPQMRMNVTAWTSGAVSGFLGV
jgi:hypothetical protein